jgi:chromate transporter
VLTYTATRWAHRNREMRGVKAFKAGMAPIVVALLVCTGWLLTAAHSQPSRDWPLWVLTAVTALVVWSTRIHLLWLLAAGAILGAMGLI